MKNYSLPKFTSNKTITNLTQYELSQEESNLLKAGLYFSIYPDKIRKSKIFTTFEKIHCSFINNLKSEETKNQIKGHLLYLDNSYIYIYKPSPHILCQHRVLQNLRKNISDTSKFEKLKDDPTLKKEASLQRFLHKLKQKTFLMKIYMINCILLVLLFLVSMVLLKCISFPLVINFLNFVRLFHR